VSKAPIVSSGIDRKGKTNEIQMIRVSTSQEVRAPKKKPNRHTKTRHKIYKERIAGGEGMDGIRKENKIKIGGISTGGKKAASLRKIPLRQACSGHAPHQRVPHCSASEHNAREGGKRGRRRERKESRKKK